MRAVILFTRVPLAGQTKTRLRPEFSDIECKKIHKALIEDILGEIAKIDAKVYIAYTPSKEVLRLRSFIAEEYEYLPQEGEGLGERMYLSIKTVLGRGYDSCLLIGSDMINLKARDLEEAFTKLQNCDVVLGPSYDGGYYLIGMKEAKRRYFELTCYSHNKVCQDTAALIASEGKSLEYIRKLYDIDEAKDIARFESMSAYRPKLKSTKLYKTLNDIKKISIIIPVYNEGEKLRSIQKQLKAYSDECEIIFVDASDTEDAKNIIDSEHFKYIKSEKGRAVQMNLGACKSSGDILVFIHCDSKLPENLTGIIRQLKLRSDFASFGIEFSSDSLLMKFCAFMSNLRAGKNSIVFGDQGIIIDRDVFFNVGPFAPIPIMEDYELSLKLRSRGFKAVVSKQHIITSDRRFPKTTIGRLRTMLLMRILRLLFRLGLDIHIISSLYKDVR